MCLRTLIRQLLAGTGWFVKAGIRKNDAFRLIKMLIGSEIESEVQLELPTAGVPRLIAGWKEQHFTNVLAGLPSLKTACMTSCAQMSFFFIVEQEYGVEKWKGTSGCVLEAILFLLVSKPFLKEDNGHPACHVLRN